MPMIVNQGAQGASAIPNILVLGGTTEASALVDVLSRRDIPVTLSYAGRVERPKPQPVPVRVGGFGGMEGLAHYLRAHGVTHLVDATHPFAARISANAVTAARHAGIAHIALTRPAWQAVPGDRWSHAAGIEAAVAALPDTPRRVMLALGRMHVDAFAAAPQHHYLLRFVDAPRSPPALPRYSLVVDRGPFDAASDTQLMQAHAIDLVICKNAGGTGAEAKLTAARGLGLPVIMIDRPVLPERIEVHHVDAVLRWLDHAAVPMAERGV